MVAGFFTADLLELYAGRASVAVQAVRDAEVKVLD